jgi:hypothetical protein
VLKQIIISVEFRLLDVWVFDQRCRAGFINLRFDRFGIDDCCGFQYLPKLNFDIVLAVMLGQIQQLQVTLDARVFAVLSDRCIESFAKPYRRVHVFTVAIIDEAARFANEAIDNMSKIEPNLVFSNQAWHLEKLASLLPDFDMIGMNTRL